MGEAKFGLIDGVVGTRAGFVGNREVVEVEYDSRVISHGELAKLAKSGECGVPVPDAKQIRPDKEPKYYLSRTDLRHLPMTELQAVRINARLKGPGVETLLSPRQWDLLKAIRAHPKAEWPNAIGAPIREAWSACEAVREKASAR